MDDDTDLSKLTGDAFDDAFAVAMIAHHQEALDMAKLIPSRAKHAEIKALGKAIIVAQSGEIAKLEGWLKAWDVKESPKEEAREMAASGGMGVGMSMNTMQSRAHGFVYPPGMPDCKMCGRDPNDKVHVNAASVSAMRTPHSSPWGDLQKARQGDNTAPVNPARNHVYTSEVGLVVDLPCQMCGAKMDQPVHSAGMPVGSNGGSWGSGGPPIGGGMARVGAAAASQMSVPTGVVVQDYDHGSMPSGPPAFAAEVNGRVVVAAPARVVTDPGVLPREIASAWEKAAAANPNFMWLSGRFVEADTPNRNAAVWSTADLELGEPSVAHGPVNWLHQEQHIIGAIASATLVKHERAVAMDVGNHIVAMAAVWPYLFPFECRELAKASDSGQLYYSMECISKEVACATPECTKAQSYVDYMQQPLMRCEHVRSGGPRRFVQPSFLGSAVILPPGGPAPTPRSCRPPAPPRSARPRASPGCPLQTRSCSSRPCSAHRCSADPRQEPHDPPHARARPLQRRHRQGRREPGEPR